MLSESSASCLDETGWAGSLGLGWAGLLKSGWWSESPCAREIHLQGRTRWGCHSKMTERCCLVRCALFGWDFWTSPSNGWVYCPTLWLGLVFGYQRRSGLTNDTTSVQSFAALCGLPGLFFSLPLTKTCFRLRLRYLGVGGKKKQKEGSQD